VERVYLIRWRKEVQAKKEGKKEYFEYYVTLPADVAREWVKVSRYVRFERDPSDPYVLIVRLVKPEEVKP
jgi:hypothetical protein